MKNNKENKINKIIAYLTSSLFERDEAIKFSLLALLSNESLFLLGPPGVAKSMISRSIKDIIKDANTFEYLMNRFSTPDEIFGPISLKKLDEDKYERKIDGYLPNANIAFLDEIWKASPSIQNTLLTIINEKIYRNGTNYVQVPLLLLIAASNELPTQGEGLEALYDRFIFRLYVNNITNKDNFYKMLKPEKVEKLENKDKLTLDEIEEIKKKSYDVALDEETFDFICELKQTLNVELEASAPYISDRKWKKLFHVLQTSAYISLRKINPSDWLILKSILWDNEEQIPLVEKVFYDVLINQLLGLSNFINGINDITRKINNINPNDSTKIKLTENEEKIIKNANFFLNKLNNEWNYIIETISKNPSLFINIEIELERLNLYLKNKIHEVNFKINDINNYLIKHNK